MSTACGFLSGWVQAATTPVGHCFVNSAEATDDKNMNRGVGGMMNMAFCFRISKRCAFGSTSHESPDTFPARARWFGGAASIQSGPASGVIPSASLFV